MLTFGKRISYAPVLGLLLLAGCRAPALPPEAVQARLKQEALRTAEAETFIPEAYRVFQADLTRAEATLAAESERLIFLRNLKPVRAELAGLVQRADTLLVSIETRRQERSRAIERRAAALQVELDQLDRLSALLNEGRKARRSITHATLLLTEARQQAGRGRYAKAEAALQKAETLGRLALEPIRPVLERFADPANLGRWQAWAEATVRESARSGGHAIVVSKIDRTLSLFRGGHLAKRYDAAIGLNGFTPKQVQGDRATPEGRYRILKKKAASKFFRALLIDYPNAEDRQRFQEEKRRGLIAPRAGIGGLIEIHGGGVEGMTDGCVALDNPDMAELFSLVSEGTPVTIVGALDGENAVARALREYREAR